MGAKAKQRNLIRDKAVEVGRMKIGRRPFEYWIANSPGSLGGFNGYVVFKKRPTREKGYSGILTYVPVHGGITLADTYNGGMVYGFDTAHCDSHKYPRNDMSWIKAQIKVMAHGVLVAQKVEAKYLLARTNKTKSKYAQMVQDVGAPEQRHNVGVNINLLSGQL